VKQKEPMSEPMIPHLHPMFCRFTIEYHDACKKSI